MLGDHLGESCSVGRVYAVENADLLALGQPEGLVSDAALHESGGHDGFFLLWSEELVAAHRFEEALSVVDNCADLSLC